MLGNARTIRIAGAAALLSCALAGTAQAAEPRPGGKPRNQVKAEKKDAAAPVEPGYALRISVDSDRDGVRQGDKVTYTTKLSNTGAAQTPALSLTQTLVPGVRLLSSTPKARVTGDRVIWDGSLAAGKTGTYSVTVEVGRLPADLRRLAAVACAAGRGEIRPIVCSAHSDPLPVAAATPVEGGPSGPALWCGIGGAIAVAAAFVLRKRLPRRAA